MIGPKERQWLSMEKCNTISSLSYYRSALRLCNYPNWKMDVSYRKALKDGFATLAWSSAFMHASHTGTGDTYDSGMIATIVYAPYQAIMEKINANDKLRSLGHENPMDARDILEAVSSISLTHSPTEWG